MGVEIQQVTINPSDKCPEHKKLLVFLAALAQVILGVLDIAFFIGLLILNAWPHASGCGIWGGILFIVTGAFGIIAYQAHKMLWIIISVALSIISAIFSFAFFIVHAVGTAKFDITCSSLLSKYTNLCSNIKAALALNAILMLVMLALFVVCVVMVVLSAMSVMRHSENTDKSQYQVRDGVNHEVPRNDVGHDNQGVAVNEGRTVDVQQT